MSLQHLPRYRPFSIVRNLARALGMVWRIAARWTVVNAALVLLQGLLPLAALYIVKLVVDFVTENIAAPDKSLVFEQALGWIALAGAVTLLAALARALGEYAAEAQSLHVTDAIADILHDQSIAVDLRYYEDPSYYDTLHRAQKEAPFRPTKIVNGLIQLAQNSISFVGILALLISFGGWMAALLVLVGLPGIVLRMMHSKRLYTFDKTQTEKERRSHFYHSVLVDVPFAKEVRLFDLGGLFKERYRKLRTEIREGKLALGARRVRSELLAQTLVTLALFGALAWLAWRALNGMLSLGDVLVYFLGFQSGLNFLQGLLKALAGLYEDNLFLNNLYRFLDLQPAIQTPPNPLPVPAPLRKRPAF
jgi:ATP-binding cassette, subfamily B, bacterial